MLGQLLILNYIAYGKDRLKFVGRTFGLLVLFFHRELFLRIQSKRPCNQAPGKKADEPHLTFFKVQIVRSQKITWCNKIRKVDGKADLLISYSFIFIHCFVP